MLEVHSPSTAGVEVNRPDHGATEALPVRPNFLQRNGVSVVVTDPLVVPSDLLHHSVTQQERFERFLLDEVLDFEERHHASIVGADSRIACGFERAT